MVAISLPKRIGCGLAKGKPADYRTELEALAKRRPAWTIILHSLNKEEKEHFAPTHDPTPSGSATVAKPQPTGDIEKRI